MCEAWYNVGALYDICGQKNEAEEAYTKARKYGLSSRLGQSGKLLLYAYISFWLWSFLWELILAMPM